MTLILWWSAPHKMVTGILMVVAIASALTFMPQTWLARMHTIQSYDADASANDRLTMWTTAWKLALAHPLTGSGFMGPYTRSVVDTVAPDSPARAVHSIWFEMLGEHGFPTSLVWLAVSLSGIFNCRSIIVATRGVADLRWASDLAKMVRSRLWRIWSPAAFSRSTIGMSTIPS